MTRTPPGPEVAQAVQDALICAVANDRDGAADALDIIFQAGPDAIYGSLCGWASVAINIMSQGESSTSPVYVQVEDEKTGKVISLDATTLDRPERDAVRWLSLYGSQDHDTLLALLKVYLNKESPEDLVNLMLEVLGIAASCAKHKIESGKNDAES